MRYMEIGSSGVLASVVSVGTFGIGGGNTWSDTKTDEGMTSSILDAALDCGVNLVDTAPVYGIGTSERFLKKALKGRREKFFIQTKCGLNWREGDDSILEYIRDEKYVRRNLRAEAIRKDLEDSLCRMGIDHVDIYITHRQSNITPVEETMGELLKMKKEGKIRAIGISNASPEILEAYEKVGHVDLVQEKFSILSPAAKEKYIPVCERLGTAFQVYSSLESGALTGPEALGKVFPEGDLRTRNKWFTEEMRLRMLALYQGWEPLLEKYSCSLVNLVQAWTLEQSPNINLLTGIRRVETLVDTAKATEISLSPEDVQKMQKDCRTLMAL